MVGTAPAPAPVPPNVPAGHVLVWSDEFSIDGLPDASRWDYDTDSNSAGWFNNERQYYARSRAENTVVGNGRLRITARLEELRSASDWGGQRTISARLIRRGKAAWTYGYFEVRAKLPCGHGTWPFDAPQYLLLNIAIGGDLGGSIDDSIFPVTMEIDHVRMYQVPR